MIWIFLTIVAVGLVAVVGALLAGRIEFDPMAEPVASRPETGLPLVPRASDVGQVHFDTALRGYRMDQVDAVLDRLQMQLAELERDVERLRDSP